MENYKIKNFTSINGRTVANQYIIFADNKKIFQSYETLMALIDEKGQVFINTDKDKYTTTTAKYLRQFLEYYSLKYDRKQIFKAIDDEEQERMTVNNINLVKYEN